MLLFFFRITFSRRALILVDLLLAGRKRLSAACDFASLEFVKQEVVDHLHAGNWLIQRYHVSGTIHDTESELIVVFIVPHHCVGVLVECEQLLGCTLPAGKARPIK